MKPTPGPWRMDGEGLKAMVRGEDATIVAVRHRLPAVVNEPNMRLIAAAPELLEALEALSRMYSHAWDRADGGGLMMLPPSIPQFEEAHAKAQDLICRVKGEAPPVVI
jgi:hypothetical protein